MEKKKRLSFLLDEEETKNGSSYSIEEKDKHFFNPKTNENILKYRCEQTNATHSDSEVIFHANVKKEYLVSFEKNNKTIIANTKLEDFVYSAEPKHFEIALDTFEELEYVKENAVFELNKKGKINNILNHDSIYNSWNEFKTETLPTTEFFRELKKVNTDAAQDILDNGDVEFKSEKNLIKTYDKNLFFHLLFDDYLIDPEKKADNKKMTFKSQIFKDIDIDIEVTETVVKEDEDFIHKRKVGKFLSENLSEKELIRQYDLFYKPMVKYNYTEYDYIYRISYLIDKKTGYIKEGKAVLSEKIKNNYEFVSNYNIKQVTV